MKESNCSSLDDSNNLFKENYNLNDLESKNSNPGNDFGLIKPGKIKELTGILKKLVKYDKDLFDIFSNIKVRKDTQRLLYKAILFLSVDDESPDNKLNQLDTPETVEEKIDYILYHYKTYPNSCNIIPMFLDTGYTLKFIFASLFEIAKGENNFGCELGTVLLFEMMEQEKKQRIKDIVAGIYKKTEDLLAFEGDEFSTDNLKEPKSILSQLEKKCTNYKKTKGELTAWYDKALGDIKAVLEITDVKDENNSNSDLNLKKDKDEQFAINRTFLGYVGSFLKNIFLDLTFINPVRRIRFSNKIKTQIKDLETKLNSIFEETKEQPNQAELEKLAKAMEYCLELAEYISKPIDDVKKRISKKSNIWPLILNAIVDTLIVLFVCSLFFAWVPVLKYIFLVTFLALIIYKGVKQYWQERRKYFATQASQCLQKPKSPSKNDVFCEMKNDLILARDAMLLKINKQIKLLNDQINNLQKAIDQLEKEKNNIDNEEKPEEEKKEEEKKEEEKEEEKEDIK